MTKKTKITGTTQQKGPESVSISMYNVYFGDCFLLTFHYANDKNRRILIDCGSSGKNKQHMLQVVDQLMKDCEGHVDAIVATHRHSDHINAFGLKGVGEKLESLNPDIVIQPWTEHPDAAKADVEAPSVFTGAAVKHIMGLKAAQELAVHILRSPDRFLAAAGPTEQKYLVKVASLSIPNKEAVLRLAKMGRRHAYVHAGGSSGLERLLPGVRVSVLGPPTLKQSGGIRKQTPWDKDEFWKLHAKLTAKSMFNRAAACGHSIVFPRAGTYSLAKAPSYVRWVTRNVDAAQLHNVRRIVRALDDVMNNTSVILLFEVGDKGLLFPGDAQLENWQYALGVRNWKRRLEKTLVYKVGHHGSTNATPKTLFGLFHYKDTHRKRMISLMSTQKGHHNQVPRQSLVDALERETVLYSTDQWRNKLSETYVVLPERRP